MGSNQNHALYDNNGVIFTYYTPNFIDNTTYVFCLEGNRTNHFTIGSTKKGINGAEITDSTINQDYYTVPHDTIYYQFNY